MREPNLDRLNSVEIDVSNFHFLHYHQDLFKAFQQYANGELLDIGCGNKPYQNVLSNYITKYTGCDIIQSSKDCVDVLCSANAIPLPGATFDTVISTQTIEHVEDHHGLVNEAFRMVKPGGYFIVSGPMYWPLHEEPYDFFRFTKYGFKYILEKAGFEVIATYANGGKWAVVGQALLQALYPQVYNVKGLKGKVIRGVLYLFGGIKSINRFFLYLDSKWMDNTNTMNYVVVAQKKAGP